MSVIETTTETFVKKHNAPIVTVCSICNELSFAPTIEHFWDENDMYHMLVSCTPCKAKSTTNEEN